MKSPQNRPAAQALQSQVSTRPRLGIISPCSQCKNRRDAPDDTGKPACPRMVLKKEKEQRRKDKADTGAFDILTDTGTDGDSFQNPVYGTKTSTIVAWVALVQDNPGQWDADGKPIVPQLFDFTRDDTEHLQCTQYPCIPAVSETIYRTQGALREWDPVEVTRAMDDQVYSGTGEYVLVGGYVRRTDVAYRFPLSKVDKDHHPEGT